MAKKKPITVKLVHYVHTEDIDPETTWVSERKQAGSRVLAIHIRSLNQRAPASATRPIA
jgi:hypothetical protein